MRIFVGLALFLMTLATVAAVQEDHGEGIKLNVPAEVQWQEGPPSLPKGARFAVLEGDSGKEGPFVFRVKAPDGYRIPVHTHPKTERVAVIAGTFNIGMGDKFDQDATQPMPVGSYGFWEAGMKHFVGSRARPSCSSTAWGHGASTT